jgi:hypothetical protein
MGWGWDKEVRDSKLCSLKYKVSISKPRMISCVAPRAQLRLLSQQTDQSVELNGVSKDMLVAGGDHSVTFSILIKSNENFIWLFTTVIRRIVSLSSSSKI